LGNKSQKWETLRYSVKEKSDDVLASALYNLLELGKVAMTGKTNATTSASSMSPTQSY
jgi:hypothetical protein